MRHVALAGILFGLLGCFGCEADDPETVRLKIGEEVIAYSATMSPDINVRAKPKNFIDVVGVPVGFKLRVLDDSGEEKVDSSRMVRITVIEGQEAGKVGYVHRSELRPIH